MLSRSLWLLMVGGVLTALVPAASAEDLTAAYDWKPMKIGGGGWMVGMNASPAEKGLMYARTDVSGAYRWESKSQTWKQVVTAQSLPKDYVGYGKWCGVDSIVGAPSDAKVAYMLTGSQPYTMTEGQVFRSEDQGETWEATGFNKIGVKVEANGEGRQEGERLAVDPVNSSVVYVASIQDGLWVTEDAGQKWTKVSAIPSAKAPHGINTVVFDPTSEKIKTEQGAEKTKRLYVTVEEAGVFESTDAGATWKKISDSAAGDAGRVRDASVGPDGSYYVAYDGERHSTGGLWKYAPAAGKWTDITPKDKEGGKDKAYWAIAADPFDPQHVVAMIHGGKTFVSKDQGATWSFHYFKLASDKVRWLGEQTNYFLSTGQLVFDPHEQGKVWYAEGFGVWWTRDLSPLEITWNAASEGIEEVCGNDVVAPPGGKPVGAMWDVGVFYFDDVDQYTARRSQPGFMSAWSLDWCGSDPKFLVSVFRSHLDFVPNAKSSGYSTDGGQTWTRFEALEKGTLPKELEYGVMAVAAGKPDQIVWCPTAGKMPYFTTDRGATWKPSDFGEGKHETGMHAPYTSMKPLCADRVEPETFYFYTPQEGLFRSTNGGATFAKVGTPAGNRWNAILKSTPGQAGHLWFASGPGTGLYHSSDGGSHWSEIQGVLQAVNVGIGKGKADGDYPAIYIVGTVAGAHGIHRSTDRGATWDKLVDYPMGIFDHIDAMDADKDVFGQVYVSFTSTGFAYGKPKAGKKDAGAN